MKARLAWLVAIWALAAAWAVGGEAPQGLRLCVPGGDQALLNRLVRQVAGACGVGVSIHSLDSFVPAATRLEIAAYDGVAYATEDLSAPAADGAPGLVPVPEPLAEIRYQVFAREGMPSVAVWGDLAGRRVGVVAGGGVEKRLAASSVVVFPSQDELEAALGQGAVDFAALRLLPGNDPMPFFAKRPLAKGFRESTLLRAWLHPRHAALAGRLSQEWRRLREGGAWERLRSRPEAAAAQRPRVLYVHSYHLGRQWEDDMTAAVNVAMPDKDFCVFHEFLNANRASLTPAYLAERRRQFRQAYANEDIDLLLVSDDPALEFVMDDYDGFFAGLPVVFAGVNDYRDPKLARFPRFTGVAQTLSAAQTLRMILRLHPDTKRVVVVNDASISGKAWQKEIALQAQEVSEVADGRLRLDFCSGRSLAEVRAVAKAQAPGAVVLLGMFLTDSRGIYCPTGQGVALIGRNCPVPVYSLMPMQGERGIIGGKVATAAEQGRAMAEIAMAVLGGRCRLEEIPVRKDDSRNVWEFDCPSLLAHGIDEARARAAVRAVDGPEATARAVFYHRREPFTVRYPTLFWGLVGGGAAAIVVIALLLFHDRRQRTLNDLLARQGEELRAQSASLAAQTALQKQQAGILEKQVAERNRILANLSERMRDAMRLPFLQGEAVPEGLALGGAAPGEAPPSANPERAFSEFAAGIYAMFDALAASVHQLALLFDTMSSGFVLNAAVDGPGGATVDYRILKVNPAAEKLLGRPAEALVGRTYGELFPELRDKWLAMLTDVAMLNKVRRLEDYIPAFGHYLEVTVYSPRQAQCVCLLNDASDRHKAVQALVEARNAATEANMAKSNFLARMSHEIRTPMNAIIGLANLLLQGRLDATQRQYLEHILGASQTLLMLINETLDLSKIEAGKMELRPRPFALSTLLDGVVNLIRPLADKKGLAVALDVAPDVPECLHGDAGKLHEVLINLCGNAVKFTDSGAVTIGCAVQERRVDPGGAKPRYLLLFKVSDTGCGIAEDYLGRIFDPFSQEDETTTRAHDGTGLGLAICRSFVEMMGGAITVQSVKGLGSQFSFTVLLDEDAREGQAAPSLTASLRDQRVLVADADAAAREAMARMLQHFGCRVLCVADVAAALAAVREAAAADPFRLLMLDSCLPELAGGAAAGWLARLGEAAEAAPKVVMVTSGDPAALGPAGGQGGAWLSLRKPYTPSQLCNVVVASLMGGAPAAAAPTDPGAEAADPLTALADWKVLLVEDNSLNRLVATELLKQCHVHCDVVVNGREAVEAVQKKHWDLVFMDVQMPVMDGYEATRRLRELGFSGPVVAMTAHAMDGDMEKSLAAGMDMHLTKPIELASLRAVLAKVQRDFPRRSPSPAGGAPGASAPPAPAPAPAGALAPAAPGPAPELFSPAEGLRLCDQNHALYGRLLALFLNEADGVAARLQAGFAKRDEELAWRELHTLKATAATLGAGPLAAAAARLGAGVKGGAWDEEGLARLLGTLHATGAAMRQGWPESPPAGGPAGAAPPPGPGR